MKTDSPDTEPRGLQRLIKRTGTGVFLQFTENGLQFAILLVMTRGFGAEIFGNYIYAITLVTFLVMFARLGFNISAIRFISVYEDRAELSLMNGYLKFSNRIVFALSALIMLLFLLAVWFFSDSASPGVVLSCYMAAPLIFLLSTGQLRAGILTGLNQPNRARIPQVVLIPATILIGILLLLFWDREMVTNGWPLVATHVAGAFFALVVVTIWIRPELPAGLLQAIPEYKAKMWLKSAIPLMLLAGLHKLNSQVDILMLGTLRGSTDAGIYTTASRIAAIPILILLASTMVVSPMFARLISRGNQTDAMRRLLRHSGLLVILVTLPLFAGLAYFGKPILGIFGEEFVVGYVPLLILLAGQFIVILSGPADVLMNMSGRENATAIAMAIGVVFNIILNATLIPMYGFYGAAVATALAAVITRVSMVGVLWRQMRLHSSPFQPGFWRK